MKYEENILKYLDGSLSDAESAELLHALSVSPEKRVILEQHLQLKDMVTSAQKPFTVPAELEQAMSRKYPVIPMYSNELMVGATIAERSMITTFFARRSVRVGGAALLLLVFSSYFALSSRNGSIVSTGGETSGSHVTSASTVSRSSGESVSGEAIHNTSSNANIVEPVKTSASNVQNTNTTVHTNNVRSASLVNTSHQEKTIAEVNDNIVNVDKTNHAINTDATSTDASLPVELALISSISIPRTEPSPSITRNSIGEPRYLDPFTKHDDGSNVPFSLRIEGVLGNAYFRVSEGGSVENTRIETRPLLGVDWIVSPHFSLGVEGSSAGIAKVVPTQVYKATENITRSVTSNTIEASNDWFGRAMLRYTFNPYDKFRVEASGGGGIAFDGGATTPLVSASAAVTTSVTNFLGFSFGVAFAGTFSEVSAPVTSGVAPSESNAMPIGYIMENSPSSTTLFSPSLTIRAGFRIKAW
ncbi:MAG TPA: hypothetical protein VIX80_03930 [Candidatus Kapabacteria bacterium]